MQFELRERFKIGGLPPDPIPCSGSAHLHFVQHVFAGYRSGRPRDHPKSRVAFFIPGGTAGANHSEGLTVPVDTPAFAVDRQLGLNCPDRFAIEPVPFERPTGRAHWRGFVP